MIDSFRNIFTKMAIALGILSFALFLVAEIHAWCVIAPSGVLFDNHDFGVIWHMDSSLPMQFRLMSYRAGGGDFRDFGFLLPAAGLLSLGISAGMHYLTEVVERWNRRFKDLAAPENKPNPAASKLVDSKNNQ